RDDLVTGVQTCALPICQMVKQALQSQLFLPREQHTLFTRRSLGGWFDFWQLLHGGPACVGAPYVCNRQSRRDSFDESGLDGVKRSEERRVGKEGGCRGW